MKTLIRLKQEARQACKFRGHTMSYFAKMPYSTAHDAFCLNCGMKVVVQVNPPANGIQIGGEAVALNCKE